ncbi:MAG: DUF2254 domain-containing protein [Cypionkella sp.]|nr:DUF2254 domain-containing protein [Cypionkella sp.]
MAATRFMFLARRQLRKLWVRTSVFAVAGVAAVVVAPLIGPVLPDWLARIEAGEAIGSILSILASSMLAVTTFSVSIMVAAYGVAAGSGTPRAVALLKEDSTSQMVLATFLGAFLFALSGLIGIRSGTFDAGARVVLFFVTLWVTLAVVVALVRWITHLSNFGRLGDTIDRVEAVALAAMQDRVANPYLGGVRAGEDPAGWTLVLSDTTGYLCHIDLPALQQIAQASGQSGVAVQVRVLPGAFVYRGSPVAAVAPAIAAGRDAAETLGAVQRAFTIAKTRTYDQDPRFGLLVLSEIAERALSPAVNDPGTALDVLGRQYRILESWDGRDPGALPAYPGVAVPGLAMQDLVEDAFAAIARDGAGVFSVQMRLQKLLLALARMRPDLFTGAALALSDRAMAEARASAMFAGDLARLDQAHDGLRRLSQPLS